MSKARSIEGRIQDALNDLNGALRFRERAILDPVPDTKDTVYAWNGVTERLEAIEEIRGALDRLTSAARAAVPASGMCLRKLTPTPPPADCGYCSACRAIKILGDGDSRGD